MDSKDTNMSDNAVDWSDPVFSSTQFEDAMPAESPFPASNTFDSYSAYNDFVDSPGGLTMRTTSKAPLDFASTPSHQMQILASRSNESSSQDSASDTSSSRKRKTTSESPASDAPDGDKSRLVMKGDKLVDLGDGRHMKSRSKHTSQRLSQTLSSRNGLFDIASAGSSPINPGAFDAALSLDEQVHGIMMPPGQSAFTQPSPLQTINPATFGFESAHDRSPATANNIMFNNTRSPRALFSSPSSDTNDAFATQGWTPNMAQSTWPGEYSAAFASPNALHFTPSPTVGSAAASSGKRSSGSNGRSRLHIAPISTKSRVETQISIIMTLESPPPNIEYLHLPLQTIAKSKLLAKEDPDPARVLELHTMLVCTSAMRNPQHKAKALRRAEAQNNLEIQQRAEAQRDTGDDEKNDPKNVPDDEKPSNGGEVRICTNCIQRERKRAARKKLKKEEEQQHWERYETERVVVFNSSELLPFKPWEPVQIQHKDGAPSDDFRASDGSIQVSAAMRIACYCRHQNEKEGFQVIFTLKDHEGKVVAQEMSDSILITDDHKTHPPNFATQMQDQVMYGNNPMYGGLPTSYSMVDMSQHAQPGSTSSRSTGNLQAMAYGQQYGLHQLQNPGFASQTTSATMTPTNSLSRPGSPTSAGNSGPNKKRKSSSFHRKVPSGLAMTPRVETGVAPTSAPPSGVSMLSGFSPASTANAVFMSQQDPAFANNGGQFLPSGPTTPSENLQYVSQQLGQHNHARANQQVPDYYQSLPSSRVNSRAPSPVMQTSRPNLAAVARQQMGSGSGARNQMYQQNMPSSSNTSEADSSVIPMIHKITPTEGPVTGGTEVSIYGRDFAQGMQVFFGDQAATAVTFYGDQALLCTSPPGRVGGVQVTVLPVGHLPQYTPSQMNKPVFTYKNSNEKVMEMALRFVSQQQTGSSNQWWQVTQQNAHMYVQQNTPRQTYPTGYEGTGNMFAAEPILLEKVLSSFINQYDLSEAEDASILDMSCTTGETPLTLASAAGMQDVVKNLLSRGANPDARDSKGFTPLMHAAAHRETKICKMLIAKGADPAMRSLSGFTAIDVAPAECRAKLQQLLWTIPRSRQHYPLRLCGSSTSLASSGASWEISSASMYESESCSKPSAPPSRRPSAVVPRQAIISEVKTEQKKGIKNITITTLRKPLPASMMAWGGTFLMQAQHFHQTVHRSVTQLSFALSPLDLEEHPNENALLRRLSTMVHALHESYPFLPMAPLDAVLPPAYDDLFPEKMHISSDGIDHTPLPPPKTKLVCTVCKSRQADQLDDKHENHECSMACEEEAWMVSQVVFWLCVPLLIVLVAAILHAFGGLPTRVSVFGTPQQIAV